MRILIADDNADSAETLAMLLRAWDFETSVAYNGLEALRQLQSKEAPSLALLDWAMPGMNGIDVCREIRKDTARPYVYIIMVTGRASKKEMLDGLNAGADDFLLKPVEPSELYAHLSAARRILDLQEQLLASRRQFQDLATRDSLTGLWNRAMILDILQREQARSRRENEHVSIIMADIDHFKGINDTHGHLVGDLVLRHTAQCLTAALRPYDYIGRYGGEEFLVVLPGCDAAIALALAERLRVNIEKEVVRGNGMEIHSVTVSLGVACWDGAASPLELLQGADDALYRAKRAGRNRAVLAENVTP